MAHDLAALARFLPVFEDNDFTPGCWVHPRKLAENHYTMPFVSLSPEAERFVKVSYKSGWVLQDFSWVKWMDTQEAIDLRNNPAVLARAQVEQLARLLTVFIRQDRFVTGGLLGDFKSGRILAIVRRADALLRERK